MLSVTLGNPSDHEARAARNALGAVAKDLQLTRCHPIPPTAETLPKTNTMTLGSSDEFGLALGLLCLISLDIGTRDTLRCA